MKISPIDIICLDETKLTPDYKTSQFYLEGYVYPPFRRDRVTKNKNSFGGGKIVFIKEGLICKRLLDLETKTAETICIELTLNNKKWFIMFGYRPESINRDTFFEEMNTTLSKAVNKYDNIMVIGDLNIDLNILNNDKHNYLSNICEVYNLKNMIKGKTCDKSIHGTSIDIMLTNKSQSFMKTSNIETGLSDHHKLILSFFRTSFQKLNPKKIVYREMKNFDKNAFLNDIKNLPFEQIEERFPDSYHGFSTFYKSIVDRHAPIKTKIVRGNQSNFMNKELNKAIMERSRYKNKYNKWKSRENYLNYQNSKKKCKFFTKKAKLEHFQNVLTKNLMTNKDFWNLLKPALSGKDSKKETNIILEYNGDYIKDEAKLGEIFNDNYINIVENTIGTKPDSIPTPLNLTSENISKTIQDIIQKYKDHPSILCINKSKENSKEFSLSLSTSEDVNKILKELNVKKAAGPGLILPNLVKWSADIIDVHFSKVINNMINKNLFSDIAKLAHVTPIYKKKERTDKTNYRPVSVIGTFSKVMEKFIQNCIKDFIDSFLLSQISAYRKSYSSSHVLIKLLETWKNHMDEGKYVGAVLMDLSKAFDCVPHDLLIAKMHAYGFDFNTLTFFYSYLKNRKQSVKINNTLSTFMSLISGVPQGSILGPILFNLFTNDLIHFIKNADIINYADDNTISANAKTINELIEKLESESKNAIKWFTENNMIVNPEKFKAILINRFGKTNKEEILDLGNSTKIKSENSAILLGIEIDDNLKFENHIHDLITKAAGQLNYLCRQKQYLNPESKKILVESFILANFNYCPLVWHFCSKESMNKQEMIQKRALRFMYDDYSSSYEQLLTLANKPTLEVRKLRLLAIEIFKTINYLNPIYMKDIFSLNTRDGSRDNILKVKTQKSKRYGTDTLRSLGPKIWNQLPNEIRNINQFTIFKRLINTWSGPSCRCNKCKT